MLERLSPKTLFLVDSMGALLTSFMLGFVLSTFEEVFGMPKSILYLLAPVAFGYSIYSFICYLKISSNWSPFLETIAWANLFYSTLTLGLVVYYWSFLTIIGSLYFILESIIIYGLAFLEFQKSKGSKS